MDNPFSWDYLTTIPGPNEVFGPFAIIFLIIFSLGFLISVVLYNDGGRRYIAHPVKRRALRRGASIGLAVFGVGLFFFAIRLLQINPLNFGMRIWLWLSLLAALIMAAYFAYYVRKAYPVQLRSFEERQRKQTYLRTVPAGTATTARVASVRTSRPAKRRRR